jgi:hypothetical protein
MSKKAAEVGAGYAGSLAEANRFDLSGLSQNREGNFTPSQRNKLGLMLISQFASSFLWIGFGFLILYIGLIRFPKGAPLAEWEMSLFSVLLLLFGLWWMYEGGKSFLSSWRPLLRDFVSGKLAIEKGQVEKAYDDSYYRSRWHQILDWVFSTFFQDDERYRFNMFSGIHFYQIKDLQFIVSQKGYNALDEGMAHILYFTPNSKKLINIEPMTE